MIVMFEANSRDLSGENMISKTLIQTEYDICMPGTVLYYKACVQALDRYV